MKIIKWNWFHSAYVTFFIAWIGHFMNDLMIGIWPIYKTLLNLDLSTAGLMLGVSAAIGEGLQMYFGHLADKGYHKKVLLLGIVLAPAAAVPATSFLRDN